MKRTMLYTFLLMSLMLSFTFSTYSVAIDLDGSFHDLRPFFQNHNKQVNKDVPHPAHVDKIKKATNDNNTKGKDLDKKDNFKNQYYLDFMKYKFH